MTEEMYESDEDQGSDEEAEAPAAAQTDRQERKLTKENASLRKRLREMQDEVLKTRFGDDVVELIPDEVTDHERRVELAGRLAERLKASSGEAVQTDQATEDGSQGEPDSEETRKLAAVTEGPSAASGNPSEGASGKELFDLYQSDPQQALRIAQAKYAGR